MIERQVQFDTSDGTQDAFVCHPEDDGPHRAVVFYMDAPGIRGELRDMARRLGTAGYYVLLPNLYYRTGTEGNYGFDLARLREDPAEYQKMFDTMATLSNARIVEDTAAMLNHVRADPAAAQGPMGCVGYCMSGPFVINVSAAYPADFAATASYHGVKMVTDKPDSPHLQVAALESEVYLGFGETDELVDPSDWKVLDDVLTEAGVAHRVEIYADAGHGFVFPNRAQYQKAGAERHWETLHALLRRRL